MTEKEFYALAKKYEKGKSNLAKSKEKHKTQKQKVPAQQMLRPKVQAIFKRVLPEAKPRL